MEGDRANGIETFATRMGVRNVTFLSEFGFCVRGFWARFRAAEGLAVVLLGSASISYKTDGHLLSHLKAGLGTGTHGFRAY